MNFQFWLGLAFNLCDAIAARTETKIDDEAVASAKKLAALPEVEAWLEKLFTSKKQIPDGALGHVSIPGGVMLAAQTAGFSAADVIKYLPILLEILAAIRAWRNQNK